MCLFGCEAVGNNIVNSSQWARNTEGGRCWLTKFSSAMTWCANAKDGGGQADKKPDWLRMELLIRVAVVVA